MPRTHRSSYYVDPGYRGTGGKTGKWGSSFWEKTLRTCTTTTPLGWEPGAPKPIALGASAALWASCSPFRLVSFPVFSSPPPPLLFLLPSCPSSCLLSLWRCEVLGLETSISSGMKENITLLSFTWSTQRSFCLFVCPDLIVSEQFNQSDSLFLA